MKKYILALVIAAGSLSVMSCEDQLSALPDQKKVVGNVIVDQKTAEVALNGVYYRFVNAALDRDAESTKLGYVNEILPALAAGHVNYPYGGAIDLEENYRVTAGSHTVTGIWSYSYQLVNAANGVLEQIEGVADSKFTGNRKQEIIAEARFLRAYGNYKLLCWYAEFFDEESPYGIMIREEFVTTNNLAGTRSNVKDSYKFILDDLEFAITNMPDANPNHYANKSVGKGLKARVLIMRGHQADYQEVITLTNEVIGSGIYQLEGNVQDIFTTKALSSKEIMLGAFPYVDQINHHDTYFSEYYGTSYLPSLKFQALLEGDPREDWLVGFLSGSYGEGMAVKKYYGEKVEYSYPMRLTEMYLLNAEAVIRSGGDLGLAKARIKEVLSHAGFTDFSHVDDIADRNELLYFLYEEWVRSMAFEDCHDWFALIRLPYEKIKEIKPEVQHENFRILPVPAAEFQKNPAFGDQNPGYSKN